MLGEMLSMSGYGVCLASSGLQALELAGSMSPALILLDILMPGMDGLEVCRKLKADPLLKNIPVIFLSGIDSTSQKLQSFREGGVDYITKPFNVEEVLARVHTHLQLVQLAELESKNDELQQSHDAQKLLLEQYTALFDFAPVGYVSLDRDSRIITINLAGASLLGAARSRIKKTLLTQYVAKEDQALLASFLEKAFCQHSRKTSCELRLFKEGRETIYVQMEALAKGSGLECLVAITDVTELRLEEQKFHIVADNTYGWEYWISPEGEFIYNTPSCRRITGYDPAVFMKDPGWLVRIIHPNDQTIFARHMHEFAHAGKTDEVDFRIIRADGEIRWISSACRPVHDRHGKLLGIRGSNRDITKRKQAEVTLKENEQQLRQLTKSLEERIARTVDDMRKKDQILVLQERRAVMGEMINNIAHQWRQPLNALGLILHELPYAYDTSEFSREYLESSIGNSMQLIDHMSQTIDDFRNFFRSDKKITSFSVNKVIKQTLSLIEKSFQAQQVSIELQTKGNPILNGFSNEYSQALLNILINARDALIVHNPEDARILIRSFAEGDKTVVTVTDNAGGIAEEMIGRLFDPYFTTKGPDKGTGIGLFMSMTIIEKNMGGRLTVSNINGGAEFRIEV